MRTKRFTRLVTGFLVASILLGIPSVVSARVSGGGDLASMGDFWNFGLPGVSLPGTSGAGLASTLLGMLALGGCG